jgi:hypothetical protein
MSNINTKAPLGEHKHAKQTRRQSSDFGEISNRQTGIELSDEEKYDKIFHNWKHPEKCSRRNRIPKCWVCNEFAEGRSVDQIIVHPNKTVTLIPHHPPKK